MAIIETTTGTKSVTTKKIPERASIMFDSSGNVISIDIHWVKSITTDGETIAGPLRLLSVNIDPSNLEQATRITRIDNSIEWFLKNPNVVSK